MRFAVDGGIDHQFGRDLQGLRQAKGGKAAGTKFADGFLAQRGDDLPAPPRGNLDPAAQLPRIQRFAIGNFIGPDKAHIRRDCIAHTETVAGGQIEAFRLAQRHGGTARQFKLVVE